MTEEQLKIVYLYCIQKSKELPPIPDDIAPNVPSYYCDPMMKAIHFMLHDMMEEYAGRKLIKTYCYWRMYHFGDSLGTHLDREAAEFSATIHIAHEGDSWPIFLQEGDKVSEIDLKPGEMLVYEGQRCPHWREEYKGGRYAQTFVHFVYADGMLTDWKYDKHATY